MDTLIFSAAVFGLILGVVVGMTAIGKGLIGTPGLVCLGIPAPIAVGTVGVAGVLMMIAGAVSHCRHKNVNFRIAGAFSLAAVPASFLFARCKDRINEAVPLTSIIAIAILLSVLALCYRLFLGGGAQREEYDDKGQRLLSVFGLGALLGFFVGATSISGSLIVVAFMLVLRMPAKLAIGTTSFVAIFSLAAASIGHVIEGHVDWWVLAAFAPAVTIGAYAGATLTNLLPQKPLQVVVVGLLFVAGVGIIVKDGLVGPAPGRSADQRATPAATPADDIIVTVQAATPASPR